MLPNIIEQIFNISHYDYCIGRIRRDRLNIHLENEIGRSYHGMSEKQNELILVRWYEYEFVLKNGIGQYLDFA